MRWCSQGWERCMWSMQGKLWRGGTIPKDLLRNMGPARVLELPRPVVQWDGHGAFGKQCLTPQLAVSSVC